MTNDIKRRHREHSRPHKHGRNSKVYEYFASHQMGIPQPKILLFGLTPAESREKEDEWLQKYKNEGWKIINTAKTGKSSGSLGSYVRKWTIEALKKEASKYKTKAEFEKYSSAAYTTALNKGIINQLGLVDAKPTRRAVRNVETGEVFRSLSAAGKKYGVSPDYISWAAQGKRDTYAGYHWEFAENE